MAVHKTMKGQKIMNKKIPFILGLAVLSCTLTACGNNDSKTQDNTATTENTDRFHQETTDEHTTESQNAIEEIITDASDAVDEIVSDGAEVITDAGHAAEDIVDGTN